MVNKDKRKSSKRGNPFISFPILIKWLTRNLTKSSFYETTLSLKVVDKILTVLKTRGKTQAIIYCKDLRLKFLKCMFNMPEEGQPWEHQGLPKVLRPLMNQVCKRRDYPLIRLALSTLYITRFIKLPPEANTETICRASTLKGKLPSGFSKNNIRKFLKAIGVNPKSFGKVPKSLRFREFHMTSKSGPNGHALWTSYIDATILSEKTLQSISTIGGELLTKRIHDFRDLYSRVPDFFGLLGQKPEVLRKLSCISDKEGKSRVIAIGDYYSQSALLPLHNYLYKLLSRINQDCTLNQIKHFYTIVPTKGHKYHSVDLSAFTDLFPIEVNIAIKEVLFGKDYAEAWKHLMVGEPYWLDGNSFNYNTGNPMGLYSSWASTSLAHHFVVFLACARAKRNWKKCPYMLLGDDIVIADDNVYREYLILISELGVEINMSKTHNSFYGFEFAKQIRFHGWNVSPFPLSALYERRNEPIQALGIILNEIKYKAWSAKVMGSIEGYYLKVLGWPKKKFLAFRPTMWLVIRLLFMLQGQDGQGKDLWNSIKTYVASWTGERFKLNSAKDRRLLCHWYVVKTVQTLFLQSKDQVIDSRKKGKLGKLSSDLFTACLLAEHGAGLTKLIPSAPFFRVYQQSQIRYNELFDELYDYGLGVQPKELRTYIGKVDIPLHDEGFYTRNRDVIVVKAMKSAKILTALIKSTPEVVAYNGQLRIRVPWAKYCSRDRQ